ncbi:MAG TPA: glycosyltransferase [Chitinophagaceae bacterium]|nr:glycosyltransferase [Chitinophagaceae bacterium]
MNRISIILPVHNGGEFVKQCVSSILNQTYGFFNLIVLDNYSNDGTKEWIETLHSDKITIYPSETLLPIDENWARVTMIPTCEYITLIGHDDILKPNYLEVMNDLIDKHPDASLYQTHFNYIDDKGATIRTCRPMAEIENGKEFLQTILTNSIDIMGTGFLMKASDYKKIGGIPVYPYFLYADFELWQSLTEISYKVTSQKTCFDFRLHQSATARANDMMLQASFLHYVDYLIRIKNTHPVYCEVFDKYSSSFITYHCKGLSHRMLRLPLRERGNNKVTDFVKKCRAKLMELSPNGNSIHGFSIRVAIIIDSNAFTRQLFLWFKKIRPKPILH